MHSNIKLFSIYFFLSYTVFGFCQSKIKGKIIAIHNGIPLAKTQITDLNNEKIVYSLENGFFKVIKKGIYIFKKEGYKEKIVKINKNQFYIIQLEPNSLELNEVVITANQIPKKLKKATASISIISSEDINFSNNVDFTPILNRTPGVFMQSGALNTNRITIRGIGSRNLYGTSKIRAYFKEIPLTNGSGETTIEDFELASISRLEIIKGAASSIYGAGLGGVIHIMPHNGLFNKSSINGEFLIGSFGLNKSIINLNYGSFKNSFRAVYSNTHSDGYRENNEYNRQTFTVNSNHFFGDNDEVSFLASFVNLKAFIPSSINEVSFLNNPKSAAFTWKIAKGYEDSKRGLIGVSWNHDYKDNFKQLTSLFTSFRNAYEPRPFNILDENTFAFGLRSRFLGSTILFNKTLKWTIGGEYFKDFYDYGTFENLYENFPSGTGSVEGERLSEFKENRSYYNLFFETNYSFSEKTTFTIGLNLNETFYNLKDQFPVLENNLDQSGNYKFKKNVSPKFGLSYLLLEDLSFFTSISHGFSPLSLNETLLPDGQINTSLKPETGWNFEIGSRGQIFKNKLQFSFAAYRLNIKNLLVSRRTDQDEFVGINAGKTQHDGLELEINYTLVNKNKFSVNTFTNYSLNNFRFKDFVDDANNYSGNDLTGVPSEVFNLGVNFNTELGLYGNINFQHVGSMPITDDNSLFSEGYNLTNFKLGYQKSLNKKLTLNAYFGINNIFDEDYASQILINASGFAGNAPRYYYPGNPVNFYSGASINYNF